MTIKSTSPGTAPGVVRAAFGVWLFAIAAGVFETVLVVASGRAGGGAAVGVAVRTAVFVVAAVVAVRMRDGRRWARWALAAGLGVLGTLSLVVDPILWLAHSNSLPHLLTHAGGVDLAFGFSRALHVTAVLTACALMFTRPANAYFSRLRPAG